MIISRRQVISGLSGALTWGGVPAPAIAQGLGDMFAPPNSLEEVARRVERAFPNVSQISPEALHTRLAGHEHIRLCDVRTPDEFNVSHLSGAERIAPSAMRADVLDQIRARAGAPTIVFYCSVGQRSSRMAARTQDALLAGGIHQVFNLRGGVFAWHNRSLPLVDALGPTPYVHPYSQAWMRLLDRPLWASMHVRQES